MAEIQNPSLFQRKELLAWLEQYPDTNGYITTYIDDYLCEDRQKIILERIKTISIGAIYEILSSRVDPCNMDIFKETTKNMTDVCLRQAFICFYCMKISYVGEEIINEIDQQQLDRDLFQRHMRELSNDQLKKVIWDILGYEDIIEPEEEDELPDSAEALANYEGYDEDVRAPELSEFAVPEEDLVKYMGEFDAQLGKALTKFLP